MKLAVDVCIGKRGLKVLEAAGHVVAVAAEHAEADRDWFARALAAGVDAVVSPDRDLAILCYEHKVRYIKVRLKPGLKSKGLAELVVAHIAWLERGYVWG